MGKATPEVFVPDLKYEGRMNDLLRSVQSKKIPVYLGNIDRLILSQLSQDGNPIWSPHIVTLPLYLGYMDLQDVVE